MRYLTLPYLYLLWRLLELHLGLFYDGLIDQPLSVPQPNLANTSEVFIELYERPTKYVHMILRSTYRGIFMGSIWRLIKYINIYLYIYSLLCALHIFLTIYLFLLCVEHLFTIGILNTCAAQRGRWYFSINSSDQSNEFSYTITTMQTGTETSVSVAICVYIAVS